MLYFKNSELTSTYRIALNTVLNWIKAAQNGKLSLELVKIGERYYIASTAQNVATVERLVEERKKYRNSRNARVVTPLPKFYELYDEKQILDIISNLDIHHEIPLQYSYFDGGADYWDDYSNRMIADPAHNLLTRTIKLLDMNDNYVDDLIAPFQKVNVVDLGPGNGLPVREFLRRLMDRGVLGRYIAIDLSPSILEHLGRNLKTWFGDTSFFEPHLVDFTQERFGHILSQSYLGEEVDQTANILLYLGGTVANFRNPDDALNVIHQSMGRNDLLVMSSKLDTAQSRRFFDFSSKPGASSLAANHRLILDLLTVDPADYEVEMGFDTNKNQRYIQARLKVPLRIDFAFPGGTRSVELEKGDAILLWRFWQFNSVQVLSRLVSNGFYPLASTQTVDKEYILTVSPIKIESD